MHLSYLFTSKQLVFTVCTTYTRAVVSCEDDDEKKRLSKILTASGVPRNFVRGGGEVQQIQLRAEDRENGDLGVVAP